MPKGIIGITDRIFTILSRPLFSMIAIIPNILPPAHPKTTPPQIASASSGSAEIKKMVRMIGHATATQLITKGSLFFI